MNEIIISNIPPQDIVIGEGGATGITSVLVNGVDVTVGNTAYVIVPTKTSELQNDSGFITSEQDPTVPYYIKEITKSDINKWNNKQDMLVSGQNIKTINNDSLLGSGNIDIDTSYTAGTGINITNENVINNTITSYNDLTDLPTIPTKTSDLQNDSGFVSSEDLSSVAFTGDYDDLINTPDLSEYITKYVNDLVNYYTKDFFFNILPKVTATGTSINLNNTAKGSQMYLTLGATELSQDATPTPSSPQDIHTISGSNKVVVRGRNLFDGEIELGGIDPENGNLTSSTTRTRSKNYIKVEPNTTYTLTRSTGNFRWIIGYNKNKIGITDGSEVAYPSTVAHITNTSIMSITFTTTSTTEYIKWYDTNSTDLNEQVMINLGSSPLPYTPYTSQEADIDLGDIEYCKIGAYSDEFIRDSEGNWELKKNIGNVKLDTLTWDYTADGNRFRCNDISSLNIKGAESDGTASNQILCNIYEILSNNYLVTPSVNYGLAITTTGLIRAKYTDTTDVNTYKTMLTNTNAILCYVLATPTYTPITGTLAEQLETIYQYMLSEQTQTNITQVNADLPFTITATTLKDLSNL